MSAAPRHRPYRNWDARVHRIERQGLDTVVLENRSLRVQILAGRGADVVEFNHKPDDTDFVTLRGEGIRAPADVAASDPAGGAGGFFDVYRGGWQEILPNGGAPSQYAGASFGQHGEVCLTPWDVEIVADTPERVAVRCETRVGRTPLRLRKTFALCNRTPRMHVTEELVNESPVEQRAMWGQHLAFGAPFLRPGCRIELPTGLRVLPHPEAIGPTGRRVAGDREHRWPAAVAPDGTPVDLSLVPERGAPSEMLYVTGFDGRGRYDLVDPDGLGLRVEWAALRLPYLWIWQELGATTDFPWFGDAYLLGLEPFSSYPTNGLAEAVANGSALRIAPGATVTLDWSASVVRGETR
jgi:hypothetical protein